MDQDEINGWWEYLDRCRRSNDPFEVDISEVENFLRHIRKIQSENDLMRGMVSDLKQESVAYDKGVEEGERIAYRKFQCGWNPKDTELYNLMHQGEKIAAVKRYRELKGCSLQEALGEVYEMMKMIEENKK